METTPVATAHLGSMWRMLPSTLAGTVLRCWPGRPQSLTPGKEQGPAPSSHCLGLTLLALGVWFDLPGAPAPCPPHPPHWATGDGCQQPDCSSCQSVVKRRFVGQKVFTGQSATVVSPAKRAQRGHFGFAAACRLPWMGSGTVRLVRLHLNLGRSRHFHPLVPPSTPTPSLSPRSFVSFIN